MSAMLKIEGWIDNASLLASRKKETILIVLGLGWNKTTKLEYFFTEKKLGNKMANEQLTK